MRTSVRSVAGCPSAGSIWTNVSIGAARCHTASSSTPSIVGASAARVAEARRTGAAVRPPGCPAGGCAYADEEASTARTVPAMRRRLIIEGCAELYHFLTRFGACYDRARLLACPLRSTHRFV